MPTPGLSLVGFLDQQAAITHLRDRCIPADPADAALIAIWQAAKAKLGAAIAGAGQPDIQPIPAPHDQYIQQLVQMPWLQPLLAGPWQGAEFKLVEIDKLLAYQLFVDTDHSANRCAGLSIPPKLEEMLP